jgi:transcriptional regulator with XRE-family HTH domain
MAEVAGNFFLVNEDKPRFGIRLRAAMEAAGVTEDELAGYLRLSEEETNRILDEKAAAAPLHQQLIAACLRRPIRDIFTDLPPEAEAPPEEPPSRPEIAGQPA